MNQRATCLCCGYPLLRHIRAAGVYWYCSHCHQEMPAHRISPFTPSRPPIAPSVEIAKSSYWEWSGRFHLDPVTTPPESVRVRRRESVS
ncbi:hypothetical protein PN462_01000 [Spirulina sp. CS-785/01]|uniref:hypothetical protein n=1 Tax=Spirulina sp. CS-785/01 TaxID=3021716 RepID=UPI00232F7820|nr:hypothetical protein [Spirulina sp. CS-785/01]MDB9311660.1 hypothetical protein [Spirulina sp. CS-785/01]